MASTVFHPATTRMHGNSGWLDAHRSFLPSGASEPSRQSFGALIILNDDTVLGGTGFGMHAHRNAEIMTLLLEGALEHADTLGNQGVINVNELQIISAGSGISHSEKKPQRDGPRALPANLADHRPTRGCSVL
ncbi:pirin family protein [Hymenobacter sp. AT01-02]|uniref:pirin family protein n=1 Tax=Hymenobacter sp. AT01-02 TaxID=1571877 RepID=UPI0009EBB680|nr:pirin family protein [Hymenobacter sp. AT01-02]